MMTYLLLCLNALVGLAALEWAWAKFLRYRQPIAEVNAAYPGLRRTDCPQWSKWRFYPGALLAFLPRLVMFASSLICLGFFLRVASVGQAEDKPISGLRKKVIHGAIALANHCLLFCAAIRVKQVNLTPEDVGHYQEYLGSPEVQARCQEEGDPRVPKRGPGPASTIISNHVSWGEICAFLSSSLHPAFLAREETKKAPFLNWSSYANQNVHVARGGTPAEREKVISQIHARQESVEVEGKQYTPLVIFAEGTTTNGTLLMPFKRGAFQAMRTVIPVSVTYKVSGQVHPAFDTVQFLPHLIMLLCSFAPITCTMTVMPEFTPNAHLLDSAKDSKGKEDWEIFADAIRDVISRRGGISKNDEVSFADKHNYVPFMHGKKDSIEI